MLFKSHILACIKLMINTYSVIFNIRLNFSLRSLATINTLFTSSEAALKNESDGKMKPKKSSLEHPDHLPSPWVIPVMLYTRRRARNLLWPRQHIYDSKTFSNSTLKQEVHILETSFKNFYLKKKSCTKYFSSSQIKFPIGFM